MAYYKSLLKKVPLKAASTALSAEPTGGDDLITPADTSSNTNDSLSGLDGNDTLKGYAGNDTLEGGAGDDVLNGGVGNDKVYGYTAADADNPADGAESFGGWSGVDLIYGGAGNDSGNGGAGNDKIYAGAGADSIGGDLHPSALESYGIDATSAEYTGYGNDTIYGGAGNDSLNGCGGADKLYGEEGDDSLYGDRESSDGLFDTSNGNGYGYDDASFSGNDILDGGAGNDRLYGRSGNDKLLGGDGNDVLAGGLGVDQMTGGSGTDYFVFALLTASPGNDKLVDFKSGEDKLWFDTDVYTALSGITEENYTTAAKAGADDYLFYYKSKLYYDADADGSGSAVLIAKIRSFDFDDLAFGTDHTAITL